MTYECLQTFKKRCLHLRLATAVFLKRVAMSIQLFHPSLSDSFHQIQSPKNIYLI